MFDIMKFLELKDRERLAAVAPPKEIKIPEAPKAPRTPLRTIGNVQASAEAQRIFDPAMPRTQPIKAPTAAQMGTGTTAALGTGGNWGAPDEK
jgi:hypothetical protein